MYRGIVSLVGGLVLLPLLGVTLPACGSKGPRVVEYRPGTFYFDWDERDEINSSQRLAVQRKFQARVRELNTELRRPVYVEALQASNQNSRDLQLSEILERDRAWQLAAASDDVVAEQTDKRCNQALREFQARVASFAEIFVTNERGMNVCVTNRTTDYYQADEDWWQMAFRADQPKNGHLQFDQSAGVVAVPAYLPVTDPATGVTIGVAKGLVASDIDRPAQQPAPRR
jgi:hypothetical protein